MWVISCFLNLMERIRYAHLSVQYHFMDCISFHYYLQKDLEEFSSYICSKFVILLQSEKLNELIILFNWMCYWRYFGRFCYCCHITFKGNYSIVKNNHNCKYCMPKGGLGDWRKIYCHSPNRSEKHMWKILQGEA